MKIRPILALCSLSLASFGLISVTHAISPAQPNDPSALSSRIEADQYIVEMSPTSAYKVGEQGVVSIVIKPKAGYHINAEYPYKFKVGEPTPEGLNYPKPLLRREDGTFTEQEGSFKLPVVASKTGAFKVAGLVSLSVCSESNCVTQKHQLETDIDVK